MHDYPKVFSEFMRVLAPGGCALFVEPGARHSKSPETIKFLRLQKAQDSAWIERDVVLEEIDVIARTAGFSGLTVRPMPHPDSTNHFTVGEWRKFRAEDSLTRNTHCNHLAELNYNERVILHCDKAE